MKWILAALALALVLQTSFILTRLQGSTSVPAGSHPHVEDRGLTADVERLSTDVAELKTRVAALETGNATATATRRPAASAPPQWPRIAPEDRCSPYDPDDYSYPQSVEPQIVGQMGGRIYGPYSGRYFASTGETDIEHIVARSEAHDSGLCAASVAARRTFSRDLLNLTLASPGVNRHEKGAKDVAEWLPAMNVCWYVNRVVAVKIAYDLTMDGAESQRAREVLSSCASTELQFAIAPIPTPAQGLSCPRNCTESHGMGMSNMGSAHPCYRRSMDRDGDGVACER